MEVAEVGGHPLRQPGGKERGFIGKHGKLGVFGSPLLAWGPSLILSQTGAGVAVRLARPDKTGPNLAPPSLVTSAFFLFFLFFFLEWTGTDSPQSTCPSLVYPSPCPAYPTPLQSAQSSSLKTQSK